MGLFSFLRGKGKKLETAQASAAAPTKAALEKELADLGLDTSGVEIDVEPETAKVSIKGQPKDQETREKVILAIGNVEGVAEVEHEDQEGGQRPQRGQRLDLSHVVTRQQVAVTGRACPSRPSPARRACRSAGRRLSGAGGRAAAPGGSDEPVFGSEVSRMSELSAARRRFPARFPGCSRSGSQLISHDVCVR